MDMQLPYRYVLIAVSVLLAAFATTPSEAQEEIGSNSAPSTSWGMLAYQRTWTPQHNNYPNAGFGFQFFGAISSDKTYWIGGSLMGSGLHRRDVLALGIGPGVYFLGTAKAGCFAFVHLGLCMTAQSGVTNFNFFTDPTTVVGGTAMSAVGASLDLFKFLRMHAALVGNVYTVDGGHTPFGFQVGITSGGK